MNASQKIHHESKEHEYRVAAVTARQWFGELTADEYHALLDHYGSSSDFRDALAAVAVRLEDYWTIRTQSDETFFEDRLPSPCFDYGFVYSVLEQLLQRFHKQDRGAFAVLAHDDSYACPLRQDSWHHL